MVLDRDCSCYAGSEPAAVAPVSSMALLLLLQPSSCAVVCGLEPAASLALIGETVLQESCPCGFQDSCDLHRSSDRCPVVCGRVGRGSQCCVCSLSGRT